MNQVDEARYPGSDRNSLEVEELERVGCLASIRPSERASSLPKGDGMTCDRAVIALSLAVLMTIFLMFPSVAHGLLLVIGIGAALMHAAIKRSERLSHGN